MDILNLVASVCSIVGLLVSLFVAQKVTKIEGSFKIQGDSNITAGRDVKARR
jgi:hypothetical protein